MRILRLSIGCTLLLFFFLNNLSGQQSYDINSLELESADKLISDVNTSFTQLYEEIKDGPKFKERKTYLKDLEYFKEHFTGQIKDGEIFRDNTIYPAVRKMLDEVIRHNSGIKNPNLYISRDGMANAYCLIDGSVVVTLGLIHFLRNEDQVSSILCHELSHKILEHSQKTIKQSLQNKNDKKKQREVKNLKNKKYNKSQSALKLLKERLYHKAVQSRTHELEADSLGFILFNNTDYSSGEFINALLLRARYDTIQPMVLDKQTYKDVFDKEGISYDTAWLEMEDFSAYSYHDKEDKINRDSLRTHPKDSMRAQAITSRYDIKQTESIIDSNFLELRRIARSHQVPTLIHQERYDFAIYLCLYRIQNEERKDFYAQKLSYIFHELHKARKEYKFNRYVESINPKEQDEDFQQLLSFLWNLNLDDLKNIAEHI